MGDYIVIVVIAALILAVIRYLYKAKKCGKRCIGCPYADACGKTQCDCDTQKEKTR